MDGDLRGLNFNVLSTRVSCGDFPTEKVLEKILEVLPHVWIKKPSGEHIGWPKNAYLVRGVGDLYVEWEILSHALVDVEPVANKLLLRLEGLRSADGSLARVEALTISMGVQNGY